MKNKIPLIVLITAIVIGIALYFMITPLRKKPKVLIKEIPANKVAIVIDDFGYNMNNIRLLDSISIPLTISILPDLRYSRQIAQRMRADRKREPILHMPMEPEGKKVRLERTTILSSMNDKEISILLNSALDSVPYAKGASSHMGSKATQDKRLIGIVMGKLKEKGLYFLDSVATPKSICKQEAKRFGVKFIRRDIFLDNIADKDYISSQIDKLIKRARQKGAAVGIGHDRPLTLQAIKEVSEKEQYDDIEFVFASELAKIYK